jgi:hypothetical protein
MPLCGSRQHSLLSFRAEVRGGPVQARGYDGFQSGIGSPKAMKSYDEIREHLQAELDNATAVHARENRPETEKDVLAAQERYERFSLHGMIPEDLAE